MDIGEEDEPVEVPDLPDPKEIPAEPPVKVPEPAIPGGK